MLAFFDILTLVSSVYFRQFLLFCLSFSKVQNALQMAYLCGFFGLHLKLKKILDYLLSKKSNRITMVLIWLTYAVYKRASAYTYCVLSIVFAKITLLKVKNFGITENYAKNLTSMRKCAIMYHEKLCYL